VKLGGSRFHFIAMLTWSILGGGITLFYPQSIPWVAFMSLYANIVGHWGAFQAARSEETNAAHTSTENTDRQ
jgi:hypothetical protein